MLDLHPSGADLLVAAAGDPELRKRLRQARTQGYDSAQDELDYGIVSVALPIFSADGTIVAAANCADVTTRLNKTEIVQKRLPALPPGLTVGLDALVSGLEDPCALSRLA